MRLSVDVMGGGFRFFFLLPQPLNIVIFTVSFNQLSLRDRGICILYRMSHYFFTYLLVNKTTSKKKHEKKNNENNHPALVLFRVLLR